MQKQRVDPIRCEYCPPRRDDGKPYEAGETNAKWVFVAREAADDKGETWFEHRRYACTPHIMVAEAEAGALDDARCWAEVTA